MPTVQSTPATMSSRGEKGVRRPFGNINVNRADTNQTNSSSKPAVTKPTHRSVQSFPPPAVVHRSSTTVTLVNTDTIPVSSSRDDPTCESRQAPSIFRDNAGEERIDASEDVLSLKLANPVSDSCETSEEEDICLPFMRIDNTAIVEAYDTIQLRGIFSQRSSNTAALPEHWSLERANPIVVPEDGDFPTGEIYPDRTQTLYTHSLLSESMLIMDMLSPPMA
ncbi:expressed unknown protein [Seminavis robusta]|uniref:Uncharacterized protein n=1 Tax=Seminavis robusta TaxID=568900 RepID=A0A9N8DHA8_9STRA|nr:expressed unknown protein [Seminavis robusta]|eukprot:Sro126_g060640.1 n/a (222) ;mRNA; r:91806-92471